MILVAACGPTAATSTGPARTTLTVFAAASLQPAFDNIGQKLQGTNNIVMTFSYAGTQTLTTQLTQGAPGDVFASADVAHMTTIESGGLIRGQSAVFAHNRLEIAVAKGNPKGIHTLADLGRSGLVVVLADPSVPAGKYAQQALAKAKVTVHAASVEQGRARRGGRRDCLCQRHRHQRPRGWRGHSRRAERDRRLSDRGPEGNAEPHRGDRVRRPRAVDRGPDNPQGCRFRGGLRRTKTPAAIGILAALGLLLFLLPLAGLIIRAPWNQALGELADPTTTTALGLSIFCSLTATGIALVLGIPLAVILARTRGTLRNILRALTTLPMVLPPVVGGVALLLAFGRRGLVGSLLNQAFGIQIPFTTAAAVMAETFVAMPFLVIAVEAGLRSLDHRYEEAARSLGAGYWRVFTRVTLPLLRPAIFSGAVLCWARALGEFGATITFAGNFPGRTQTVPIAVYLALESKPEAAITLSLILLVVSVAIVFGIRNRWLGAL